MRLSAAPVRGGPPWRCASPTRGPLSPACVMHPAFSKTVTGLSALDGGTEVERPGSLQPAVHCRAAASLAGLHRVNCGAHMPARSLQGKPCRALICHSSLALLRSRRLQRLIAGGCAWRCPRLQTQVREDFLDHWLLKDRSDDLQLAAAVRAVLQVEIESEASAKRIRCSFGLGTSAASRCMNSSGDNPAGRAPAELGPFGRHVQSPGLFVSGLSTRCVVPSRQRVLSLSTTCQAALVCTRSLARAGRVMQRHSCSSAWRSSASQRTAACRLKPCMSAHSVCLKSVSRGMAPCNVSTFWPARGPKTMR